MLSEFYRQIKSMSILNMTETFFAGNKKSPGCDPGLVIGNCNLT